MTTDNLSEILARVRRIQIVASRTVDALFAGQYRSVFRGQGMEFEEVRLYQPGDDIRSIDWNVTARSGDCYIKRFCEERELTVIFVVDISASNAFGTGDRSKLDRAVEIAALLMFSALRNNDKVGLLTFCDHVVEFLPARKGKSHVLHLIRQLVAVRPLRQADQPDTGPGVLESRPKAACRGLMSDFLDRGFEHVLAVTSQRHDITALTIWDERERELPDVGFVRLQDAETGVQVELDTRRKNVRDAYRTRTDAHRSWVSGTLKRARVGQLCVDTRGDYLVDLHRYFRLREQHAR